MGGTFNYMDEEEKEFRSYSHISIDGKFVSAEIDAHTGESRIGDRAETPPMITEEDQPPASPTYCPPGLIDDDVDQGFEDSIDCEDNFICTPVLQMY